MDPLGIVGSGDRAFDEREAMGAFNHGARGLEEFGDLPLAGDSEQLVLAIEQAELAAMKQISRRRASACVFVFIAR